MYKSAKSHTQIQRISYALCLLLIMSQSLATEYQCTMEMSDHDMSVTQTIDSSDPHAGHHMMNPEEPMQHDMPMAADLGADTEMDDCCDYDCQCAQKACSSTNALLANVGHTEFDIEHKILFINQEKFTPFKASSALYRPPIFC